VHVARRRWADQLCAARRADVAWTDGHLISVWARACHVQGGLGRAYFG
jgi:hypothetical protein